MTQGSYDSPAKKKILKNKKKNKKTDYPVHPILLIFVKTDTF